MYIFLPLIYNYIYIIIHFCLVFMYMFWVVTMATYIFLPLIYNYIYIIIHFCLVFMYMFWVVTMATYEHYYKMTSGLSALIW